jgi:hypothetical protein
MENPVRTAFYLKNKFVAQVDNSQGKLTELAQDVIVVTGEVVHFGSVYSHFQDSPDDFHVFFGEIALFEIPDIEDIPIEDDGPWLNGFQVIVQFTRMATVCSKVNVR